MKLKMMIGFFIGVFGLNALAQSPSRFTMSATEHNGQKCYTGESVLKAQLKADKQAEEKCSREGFYYTKRLSTYDVNMTCDRIDGNGYAGERGNTQAKAEYFCTNKSFEKTDLILENPNTIKLKCEGQGAFVIYRSNGSEEKVQISNPIITLAEGEVLHYGNYVGGGWYGYYHRPFFSIENYNGKYSVGRRNNGLGEFQYTSASHGENIVMFNGRGDAAVCIGIP